jgi:hypothetical protein
VDNLNSLLPRVIRELGTLSSELQKLDRVLNGGEHRSAEAQSLIGSPELSPVRANRYKGKRAIEAAIDYVRENRGVHIPLSQIIDALVQGGADPGKARRGHETPAQLISHTLKIGIPSRDELDYEPKGKSPKDKPVIPKKVSNNQVFVWLSAKGDVAKRRKR